MLCSFAQLVCFFFNDTATTEIYTLSLHDALPISINGSATSNVRSTCMSRRPCSRSEEHTSELQSPCNLVCRLLLEKKRSIYILIIYHTTLTLHHTVSPFLIPS